MKIGEVRTDLPIPTRLHTDGVRPQKYGAHELTEKGQHRTVEDCKDLKRAASSIYSYARNHGWGAVVQPTGDNSFIYWRAELAPKKSKKTKDNGVNLEALEAFETSHRIAGVAPHTF